MSSSLAYFDTYRRERVPANLVQAQRDCFGAHTYERVDMPRSFHTEWFKIACGPRFEMTSKLTTKFLGKNSATIATRKQ